MINPKDLNILKDKVVYNTSNEEYVVYENDQRVIKTTEYKILGFLNDHIYSKEGKYLIRSTLSRKEICRLYLDVEYGVFKEKFGYMYFYKDRTVYKVNEYMEVEWSILFDDYIQSITMDNYGSIYILFKNSCTIRRYSNTGEYLLYLNDTNNLSKTGNLYSLFVSEGCGHVYVVGNYYNDNKCTSFIDHYNARTCEVIDHIELFTYSNVNPNDDFFSYNHIFVDGDFIYLYANSYIEKINIVGRQIWRYTLGYNYLSDRTDTLTEITFDEKMFKDRIFFCENLNSTNGYSLGKLSTNGDLMWKLISPSGETKADFNVCIYKDIMYLTGRYQIASHKSYVLSVDNNNMLFETRDNKLIRVVQYNYEELYDDENYIGKYLLGKQLKENVDKFLTTILDHNSGHIIFRDNNNPSRDYYLYLRENNKELIDDVTKYDYFKMLGFEELDEAPNALSRILTKDKNYITTYNGSYITTLFPYLPDVTYQYIVTPDGTMLQTDDGQDIVRNRGLYTQWYYILADEYIYGQDIVTKMKEDTIITKKKGLSIMRKQRVVWRYVVKTMIDVDLIVEHLMENGILETMLPEYVDKLRHHTSHMIKDMQLAHIPTYFDMGALRTFQYKYDAYDYPLRISNTMIYMCKNIPYIKKDVRNKIFIKPMNELVIDEVITPFIIFIDGKAIKWSNITIVKDWQFSYIIISNCKKKVDKFESIVFPCYIRYGEDNNILENEILSFYFDEDGLLTSDKNKIAMRLEVIDKDVIGSVQNLETDPNIKVLTRDYDQLADLNNIFIFENNQLFGNSRLYMDCHGKNIYTYIRPNIGCICKTFYFDDANDSKSMIFDIPNQEMVESNIIEKIDNGNPIGSDYFMPLFDFKLSKDKTYLRNISEATKYILTYNMSLLVDFYRDQSNIKSFVFTGERIIFLSEEHGGLLYMPRQHVGECFDHIIMFVNDKLYEYYREIKYTSTNFVIPIFTHVKKGDKVEIIHFKNVNNEYSSLTITPNKIDYIAKELRYNDFLLFGNSYSGKGIYDSFSEEECDQYPIEFEYQNVLSNNRYQGTRFSLSDPYYIGKPINIVSKRQFHFMYYNVMRQYQSSFDLEPEFRFCHNKNQYMVFVNSLKLNFNQWDLQTMNDANHRERITITTEMELQRNDLIEIFYIPDPYEEIILDNHLSKYGDIILDVSELDYSFDNELFLIFIDGKKINKDDVQNISMNRVRIRSNYPVNSNVTICKYLQPDKILEKIFSYGDKWSNAVNSISENDYNNLFVKLGLK